LSNPKKPVLSELGRFRVGIFDSKIRGGYSSAIVD